MRANWRVFAVVSIGLLLAEPVLASHVLKPRHQKVLAAWLKEHPNLRLATQEDCGVCDEDVRQMRRGFGGAWKAIPDYHPYRVVGDFNSDGNIDFAVVLVDTAKKEKALLLAVFNGPFRGGTQAPAFVEANIDLQHQGLFYGPPRPKPFRLVVGAFESEGGLLEPYNATYRWTYDEGS